MSNNFGTGVSRVLDPSQTSFLVTIWQQGKPPLDAELNLLQQIANEWNRQAVLRGTPSGFLANDTNTDRDYVTSAIWSNWFQFGQQKSGEKQSIPWAVVNGWLIPVTGTQTGTPPGSPNNTDTWNRVTLGPPPNSSGDSRIDFVFLEAWLARVPPNPSTLNKPAAASIYRYGNVEGGYSFLADDLVDPAIGFETTQRVQVQYRIRVVTGLVGLASYPDGFDPSVVKAQGAATATTSFTFTNMRQELGDPGLWRAGDGTANSLGTVDGYTYAIPLCAVFRRNSVAWDGDPFQNLNGGFNRNPTALDRTGWRTFSTTPSLAAGISDAALVLTLASASNIPLPTSPATPVYIQIGDEILAYSSITGTTMTIFARAQFGTKAEAHYTGDTIKVLSGRPDGLYSDQIAKTDILDLRHAVNPNGFDYTSLLHQSFDKLLRGQLRSNWKYSGGGPQGSFVFYEDKIGTSAALGVTKLDAPDNIRMVFSDAAMMQKVEVVVAPATATAPPNQAIGVTWGLSIGANATLQSVANQFSVGDTIEIDITQFKNTFPGGDTDQIHFVNDGMTGAVEMRIDGSTTQLVQGTHFDVSPANPTDTDNLVITFLAAFASISSETTPVSGNSRNLYITATVQYGGGRGLSRRPDSLHSVSFLSPSTQLLTQLSGQPLNNIPMRVSYAPLWSKYRNATLRSLLPSTAEAYADLGSKSVFLTPFRRIDLPDIIWAYDGTNINANTGAPIVSSATGSSVGTTTFTDLSANFLLSGVIAGDTLIISSSPGAGTYKVVSTITATTFVADRIIPTDPTITYTICHSQGLMPLNSLSGAVKWTTTDPLNLFSGTTYGSATRKNIFATFPRHLIPAWGEVKVPILYDSSPGGIFNRGINYTVLSKEGGSPPDKEKNYVAYSNGGLSYAPFSTVDLNTLLPSTYNAAFVFSGNSFAGMRKFTDTRGLGREGLELPPFYGVARLFGVYEAGDYKLNGSAFANTTRAPVLGGAANLLRQNFDGATFWVELDADGDSTFILNADAIDIKKSLVNPIASFGAGDYVIEASIFGFDRGTFDLDQQPRIVLTRERADSQAGHTVTRDFNYLVKWDGSPTAGTSSGISAPDLVVPGPMPSGDEAGITFSRQPYQGDAWGSQTVYQDTGYAAGPLTSGTMYQLVSTTLDQSALTRPNQKPLEVLAALRFTTTLGTGRLSGDFVASTIVDFRNVGYEDFGAFPPASGIDPRPRTIPGAGINSELGTTYLGLTDRLPLGATFRDKDFRGEQCGSVREPFQYHGEVNTGNFLVSQAVNKSLEQDEINLSTSSVGYGAPGEIAVQVDGEPGNYGVLTNFRTNRGGSMFLASGLHPGGELAQSFEVFTPPSTPRNFLGGLALLVRNQVTSVGATEVSAGDELMMAIVTTGIRSTNPSQSGSFIAISTAGTAEGMSASDLYRVQGRPLLRDNEKTEVDPNDFDLSLAISLVNTLY